MKPPKVIEHHGIKVVRDDLFPGGTRARYMAGLYDGDVEEIVYPCANEDDGQSALAWVARQAGRRATIFVPLRLVPHPRSLLAKQHGAKVYQVPTNRDPIERAQAYVAAHPGTVLFSADKSHRAIMRAARATKLDPREVWCAAPSPTIALGLMRAWPLADFNIVQVDRELPQIQWPAATRFWVSRFRYETAVGCRNFPSDPHADSKAWSQCVKEARADRDSVVFWNVTGPAERELIK